MYAQAIVVNGQDLEFHGVIAEAVVVHEGYSNVTNNNTNTNANNNNRSSFSTVVSREPVPACPTSQGDLRQIIEIYENERYSPRLGFALQGLLIADRKAFSNQDGTFG